MNFSRLMRKVLRFIVKVKREVGKQFLYRFKHLLKTFFHYTFFTTEALVPILALILFGLIINDIGFNPFFAQDNFTNQALRLGLLLLKIAMIIRFISGWYENRKLKAHAYSLFLVILSFFLLSFIKDIQDIKSISESTFQWKKICLYAGITFLFLTEVSSVLRYIYTKSLNASFLFITGFSVLILLGGFLLSLPNATVNGISPLDALFTSASAVCVTGLIVVDTATTFTKLGQGILLGLIQIGGLGIMTFTALLSYLAAGSVSFQSQLALKDMLYSNKMNNVMQLVARIIIVTLFFEFIGYLFIHASIGNDLEQGHLDIIFFSVFHSVSAFCNAGFSTLSEGLYETPVRHNYPFHIIIALLVILGGIGFPIVFNLFTFIRIRATNVVKRILKEPLLKRRTHIIHINSKLAFTSTLILLALGFITYLIFEQENTLAQHPTVWGKVVTAFFASVTPRTAGFNTVDLTVMNLPTVMIYLLLMWIGGSPGSTAGGIKTTTASVAFLNLISIIRGKDRTEVFHTQLAEKSISKSFAVVLLSLLIIGTAITLIAANDGDKSLLRIAFEVFSAFSTVGLTLGLTQELSDASKIVLIFVMFIGRVGALTIFIAFVNQKKQLHYRYPKEEIIF